MGFLNHSTNNIIIDAVLTEKGRELLSRNSLSTKNGFANPFAVSSVINKLREPNDPFDETFGYYSGENIKIKPNVVKGYTCDDDGEIYYFNKLIKKFSDGF